jgi:ComF family protein
MPWRTPIPLLAEALDFLYPRVCSACAADLDPTAWMLCDACQAMLVRVESSDRGYQRTFTRLREGGCVDDLKTLWFFEKDGPLQALLHRLKYGARPGVGRWFGEQLGDIVPGGDLIVPVPLHPAKLRERGYNQSAEIARGMGSVKCVPVDATALHRCRFTETQTHLTIEERRRNVDRAFGVRTRKIAAIREKTIILVDDVVTTGATIRSCAQVLRECGAARVIVASVALARLNEDGTVVS